MPTVCRRSDAHWTDNFAEQQFSQHDSNPRRQLRTDVLTGVHLQSFFCLDGTRQASVLLWHMMAHLLHRIQQSFGCVSAVAKRSPASKTLITHCTISNSCRLWLVSGASDEERCSGEDRRSHLGLTYYQNSRQPQLGRGACWTAERRPQNRRNGQTVSWQLLQPVSR